jgi:putative transposase
LYFLGLSFRNATKELSFLHVVKISHVSIWNWIQKYNPQKLKEKKNKNIEEYFCLQKDETAIKVGSELIWFWVSIEPKDREILSTSMSKERKICLLYQNVLSNILNEYGEHPISTDGEGTWYPQACKFLKIGHHLHSTYEKSIIERTIHYIKDRTEIFGGYFPCRIKNKCKSKHVKQRLNLFIDQHNKEIMS